VHAEVGGGLVEAGLLQHGTERREALPSGVGAAGQDGLQEGARMAHALGQVLERSEEAVRGQPVAARDPG
jgi:hypothetical protein